MGDFSCLINNYFFLFFFGLQANFAIATMATTDQTTWSVKENRTYIHKCIITAYY